MTKVIFSESTESWGKTEYLFYPKYINKSKTRKIIDWIKNKFGIETKDYEMIMKFTEEQKKIHTEIDEKNKSNLVRFITGDVKIEIKENNEK